LLRSLIDILPADLAVIRLKRFDDIGKPQFVFDKLQGIDLDLELALLPAPGHNVIDAGGGAQNEPHVPVLKGPKIHVADVALEGFISAFERVPEDLTETRRIGTHFGRAVAFGNAVADFREPLHNKAPREIDIDAVLEINGDIGKAEEAHRADFRHVGKPRHRRLYGERQQLLDVLGGKTRRFRIDIDLNGRHVRESVDGNRRHGAPAEKADDGEDDEHQNFILEREFNEFIQHIINS